jgi:hypothetical protein
MIINWNLCQPLRIFMCWAQFLHQNISQMRKYTGISILIFLNICCISKPSRFVLQNTNWRFVSFAYDSNYAWDTFETFTNQKINRLTFTRDSLFIIKNDSSLTSVKYSIKSDTLMISNGKLSNKVLIRKLTNDTLLLHDTFGQTYIFTR